jgi:hypothetical protein
MPRRDIRRYERIPCSFPIRLAWTDADGSARYSRGQCRDISPDGLRIETNDTIPAQSYVNLRVETMDVAGGGRVRYYRRGPARNVIGLELSQKVRQQLLDAIRDLKPPAP